MTPEKITADSLTSNEWTETLIRGWDPEPLTFEEFGRHKVQAVATLRTLHGASLQPAVRAYERRLILKAKDHPLAGRAGIRLLRHLRDRDPDFVELLRSAQSDHKPVSRALSLMMIPGPLRKEILGADEMPSRAMAHKVLLATHPFFEEALTQGSWKTSFWDSYLALLRVWQ